MLNPQELISDHRIPDWFHSCRCQPNDYFGVADVTSEAKNSLEKYKQPHKVDTFSRDSTEFKDFGQRLRGSFYRG